MIYLDNAATTLKKPYSLYPRILYNSVFNSSNSGRGGHYYSVKAATKIYETSEALSSLFNIPSPEQIAYTQNATYALNLAILGILSKDSHVIITQMEHNSVIRPVHKTCSYSVIKADRHGNIKTSDIENMIQKNTKMIISTHASNVCGTIMPIDKISQIAHKNNLYFLLDAAQSAGSIPIDVQKSNIDLMAFSGHKGLMAPMGVGGLYVKEGIELNPVITGGTGSHSESKIQPSFMPDVLQSGTLNAPAIISAKNSVDFIIKHTPKAIGEKEKSLALLLIEDLMNMKNVSVYGNLKNDRNSTVAFNINNIASSEAAQILNNEFKICVRGGWHCAFPAHIALGTQKLGAVRASFGYFNKKSDVKKLCDAVYKISKN